jgi:serine/threonine-protein kinase RsbW
MRREPPKDGCGFQHMHPRLACNFLVSGAEVAPMTRPERRFETSTLATSDAITDLTDQVMAFLTDHGVETRATHHTALVLNEVLTNLGTHGDCRDRPARIALVVEPDKVTGEIVDAGPPFDPRLAADPDFDVAFDDRPIGGLGLYLVRKLSSALEYTRRDEHNYTSFAISRQEGVE